MTTLFCIGIDFRTPVNSSSNVTWISCSMTGTCCCRLLDWPPIDPKKSPPPPLDCLCFPAWEGKNWPNKSFNTSPMSPISSKSACWPPKLCPPNELKRSGNPWKLPLCWKFWKPPWPPPLSWNINTHRKVSLTEGADVNGKEEGKQGAVRCWPVRLP